MKYHNFNIWQNGMKVAGSSGHDRDAAHRDALHYAMMFEQDGPVVVKEGNKIVYRTPHAQENSAS